MLEPEDNVWCPYQSYLPSSLLYCTVAVAWKIKASSSDFNFHFWPETLSTCININIWLCTRLLETKSFFFMLSQKELLLTIENDFLET